MYFQHQKHFSCTYIGMVYNNFQTDVSRTNFETFPITILFLTLNRSDRLVISLKDGSSLIKMVSFV